MHILQPKQTKLKDSEVKELLSKLNINPIQLPKIKSTDPGLPEECKPGDIVKIERKSGNGKTFYYRVVVE